MEDNESREALTKQIKTLEKETQSLRAEVSLLRDHLSYVSNAVNTAEVSLSFMHEAKHALHNVNALFHSIVDLIPRGHIERPGNKQLLNEVIHDFRPLK